jgi:hypothetical protein
MERGDSSLLELAADGYLSRATSKGPPFCHKLGTTSAVVGRVLIFV